MVDSSPEPAPMEVGCWMFKGRAGSAAAAPPPLRHSPSFRTSDTA